MRLTLETGPHAGAVVPLDRDVPTLIGSGDDCPIRIPEAGVQRHHAVVKALKDAGFGIKAIAPGVRVNGREVEAAPLHDGDVIEIGTTRIAFGEVQRAGMPVIAGYRILGELGKGGMGVVWRAEQTSLHREVALKVLTPALTKDPQFVAKFVAEARAAAKLQHANVVQVFDVEHDGDTYYYAMELMLDGSLEAWLRKNGKMPIDRALQVVADAARGLAYAESLGIVHRDVKPDNLMVDRHGTVKLADLGLAHADGAGDGTAAGTPHFMAPEQALRKPLDHRTDLYALGCTFYRLLTGKTPFRGETTKDILRAQVKDEPVPVHEVEPSVPLAVSAIVHKLMAKDPDERHQSANELLEEVGELLRPPAKKGLWIGLSAAAVVIAGAAIWFAVTKKGETETVHLYRDNPEAQRLAVENDRLKADAKEDKARIALLETRLLDAPPPDKALALDGVAAAHRGTRAAGEATAIAGEIRAAEQKRVAAETELRSRIAAAVQALEAEVASALEGGRYGEALSLLGREAPPEIASAAEYAAAVTAQERRVREAARGALGELERGLATAKAARDAAALDRATKAFAAALADGSPFPPALIPDRETKLGAVKMAEMEIASLRKEKVAAAWEEYRRAVAERVLPPLQRADCGAAAAAANELASASADQAVQAHATKLAAALAHGETFAKQLESAAAEGKLQLAVADGAQQPVGRWARAQHELVLLDPSKKPPKESPLPCAMLDPQQWQALAEQVNGAPAGARDAFVAFTVIALHAAQAKKYLAELKRDDDASGTGQQAYPLGPILLEQLLRRLPEGDAEPWTTGLRHELQAAQRLAAGLRALSERRNRAAESHLQKLLAEHPHSVVVAALQ